MKRHVALKTASALAPALALALAGAAQIARAAEPSPEFEARLRAALDEVARLCPPMSAYPEPVEAIPLPWEVRGKTTDELLKMLDNWNPAYVAAVSEGVDIDSPGAADALLKSLKSSKANVRQAAMTAIGNSIDNKIKDWQSLYPDLNYKAAQQKVRHKYIRFLPELAGMLKDPSPVIRGAAPEHLKSFLGEPEMTKLAPQIVPSICDRDEDVAEKATLAFAELLLDVPAAQRLELLEKALRENPKPRGRGKLADFICTRLTEDEQRKLIPVLIFHLQRVETRDMMFANASREQVVKKLAQLGQDKVILPHMLKYLAQPNPKLAVPALEAVEALGPRAVALLPQIEAALKEGQNKAAKPDSQAAWRQQVGPVADRVLGKLRKSAKPTSDKQEQPS